MTTGSVTDDRRFAVTTGQYYTPGGFWVSGPTNRNVGAIYTKVWNGTDYPPTKPVYSKETLITREGKVLTYKKRVDLPTRRKSTDHPYTMTRVFQRDNQVIWDTPGYRSYAKAADQYSAGYVLLSAGDAWNSNDDIALLGKLREAVAGSDFNMGVFLGEGREALHMITDSATRIYKAYKKARKFELSASLGQLAGRQKKSIKKTISDNWLMTQYGVLPLVQDAQGAAEFLAKTLNFPMIQTYKVRKKKFQRLGPISNLTFNAWWGHGVTQGQIIARLEEASVAQLTGLLDPASVLWEKTPYSFVADWFIPIGNYLAARSLASALTGTFVTTLTTRTACEYYGRPSPPGLSYVQQPSGSYSKIVLTRSVSTSLNVPLPRFKTLDKVASWKHCANAVALLVSGFGSGSSAGRRGL